MPLVVLDRNSIHVDRVEAIACTSATATAGGSRTFECDDVIRRARVSRSRRQQQGYRTERPPTENGGRSNPTVPSVESDRQEECDVTELSDTD